MITIKDVKKVFDLDINNESLEKQIFERFYQSLVDLLGKDPTWTIDYTNENKYIELWKEKLIVPDGQLSDIQNQIEVSKARWYEDDHEVGEDFYIMMNLNDLDYLFLDSIKKKFYKNLKDIQSEFDLLK